MKYSTSRDKLSQMHEALDRELEMAGHPPLAKSRKERDEFRFISQQDESKKANFAKTSNKPIVYDHQVREVDIKTKKNQISELERKLMELQQKMDNISVSSGEQVEEVKVPTKDKLNFRPKNDAKPNEDTARFLVQMEPKQRVQTKFSSDYPAFADQQEQDQDSEQYFQIQQAILKRKAEQRAQNQRKSLEKLKAKEKNLIRLSRGESKSKKNDIPQETDRKISVETESVLRPKYSNQKSNRSNKNVERKSNGKGSIRQSIVSKKSLDKQKKLPRTNSRGSLRSSQPAKRNIKNSQERNNRSFDRSQGEDIGFREEEAFLAKELKKASNQEKQLQHFKRLSKKLKEQLQGYKVMEIEFRQLKKNFAKSEAIRLQQKKIIQTLKTKIGR